MSQIPNSSSPIHTLPRSAWILLLIALGIAASASRAGLGKMVEVWLGSAEYSHAILIPFIAGFLIWQRKDVFERIGFRGSWGGLAVVAMGSGLLLLGRLSALLVVQQYALLIVVYGLVLCVAGWKVVKLLGMPLLLLLFMVPLPQFLMQSFSAQLQLISSQLGVGLIRLLGISVYLEGNVIDLGSYKLEVAEACSGLRYLFPLMTIGLILAYFYQAPAWKRAFIFLSSIPITILMNSFRVGAIGVLVEFWGPGMARGFVHQAEGWVVFMASLGVLLIEINLLSRVGRDRRPWRELMGLGFPEPVPAGTRRIVNPLSRPLLASAGLLAALAVGLVFLPERVETAPARVMFSAFPDQVGAWQGHRTALDRDFLDALKLDDYILADYSRPGAGTVNFYAAWYNSQAAGESVHSPRSCIPGGGWRIAEFGQRELTPLRIYGQPLRVNRAVIEYGSQRQLVYYWFMQRGRILTNEYLVKWYLFQDSIEQHRSDGALVRFVLPLKAGQVPQEADAELQQFIGDVAPRLDAYLLAEPAPMDLLLGFIMAMCVTMVLIPPLMRVAGWAQVIDRPGSRKVHTAPIPRVGGIAMAVGVLLALALWGHFDRSLQAFSCGILVLLGFGIWDDRSTLGWGAKFLGQALAVLVAMAWGGIRIASITASDRLPLPEWIAAPLTFFFLVGATNAINLADGLDGLAGGMALLCLGALALLALTFNNPFVGTVALIIAGAILGFLRFNTHPARVFMGDCGSQILGYSVAVLSVSLTQDPLTPVASALPLLLLGVPVMDTLMVMSERLFAGRSPFKADRTHIHHKLLALGFDHHEAVMVIYLLQACLFVAAWFMRYDPDLIIVLAFAGFAAALVMLLRFAATRGWRWRTSVAEGVAQPSGLQNRIEWLRAERGLPRWSGYVTGAAILDYCAIVLLRLPATANLRPLLILSAAAVALNLAIRWRHAEANWIDKGALYLSAVLATYIDGRDMPTAQPLHYLELALFSVLAVALVLRVWWSRDRQFSINPLDLLVIFTAVTVPNLPGSIASPQALGATVAKLVLLLYGLESLSATGSGHWRWLSVAALLFLLGLAASGLAAAAVP